MSYRPELLKKLMKLVEWDFVRMQTSPCGRLMVFKYSEKCVKENGWEMHPITRTARGIILNQDGIIVARPFDKFFNLTERPETQLSALPLEVALAFEKFDGSCAVSYILDDKVHISTLGSFESDQAKRAERVLYEKYPQVVKAILDTPYLTWIFEIIYPENRIVVDYGEREELVLLGQRFLNGTEVHPMAVASQAAALGLTKPFMRTLTHEEIINLEYEDNTEGWVLWYANGLRVKMKSPLYVRIHRLLDHVSPKRVIQLMSGTAVDKQGNTISLWDVRDGLPTHLIDTMDDIIAEIQRRFSTYRREGAAAWTFVRELSTRKKQAVWLKKNVSSVIMAVTFSMLDGKSYDSAIYKKVLEDIKEETK